MVSLSLEKQKRTWTQTAQKCGMLLRSEFVFHCHLNASPCCLQEKNVSCMVPLMLHFPMKGQDFARSFLFSFLLSLYVSSFFTMIFFLFNWLVSFCFFFFPPLLTYLLLSEKKTQRGSSWRFSFFIIPLHSLSHSSVSLLHAFFYHFFLSLSLSFSYSLTSSNYPVLLPVSLRSAVQSCSKSRVCSCWSSSIFPRLLDPSILSRRFSQDRKGGQSRGRTKTDGRGQGKLRPVLSQR